MEKLDVDTLRGRLSEAFSKPVIAEVRVWMGMEALWHLRKLGARKFVDVVSVETSLSLQRAELLVRCWEVARGKNRDLVRLCLDRPWEFVELVELVEGFLEETDCPGFFLVDCSVMGRVYPEKRF